MTHLSNEHASAGRRSPLVQWFREATGLESARFQFKLHGNNLHVLIEDDPCPDQNAVLASLILPLQRVKLNDLMPANQPQVYQLIVYGRKPGETRAVWAAPLDLHQLDRYLEELFEPEPAAKSTATTAVAALVAASPTVTNRMRAQQGDPEAVARHLSETLSELDVAVRVQVKAHYRPQKSTRVSAPPARLWITCGANYSPDPALIAEPIARKLRALNLEQFQDALVLFQVAGEDQPDWALRVDLTPQSVMLRELARWGDVEAIARLLNDALLTHNLKLSNATLRESTLHLTCTGIPPHTIKATDLQVACSLVAELLEPLIPQGIHAITLYGQEGELETPTWAEWVELPAAHQSSLALPPLTLARQGDWDAIEFLLKRLLNDNLEERLATGGIRLQLMLREDLLHVMCDAPVCPDQRQVGTAITRFLKELHLPDVSGVRVYGRRSGQKHPLWSFAEDFVQRQRLVPEAAPEFAATAAYVSDLIDRPGELALRVEEAIPPPSGWEAVQQRAQRLLVGTHLFITDDVITDDDASESVVLPGKTHQRAAGLALIWGAAGLMLVVQADWSMNRLRSLPPPQNPQTTAPSPPPGVPLDGLSGLTAQDRAIAATLPFTPPDPQLQTTTAAILAGESPYPTFNSRQLDEKLLLYSERLKESGPPDVLIIGSSRAMRGIDPVALQTTLEEMGYNDATVFNFGINGATAQVVDLILRGILKPDQLPKLVIWADGARAFNGGTVDVTYNGIAVSQGYRQLVEGTLARPDLQPQDATAGGRQNGGAGGIGASLASSYQKLDRWLSDRLGTISIAFEGRDRLKNQLQQTFTLLTPPPPADPQSVAAVTQSLSEEGRDPIDFNGFLPIALRFNPATYYQEFARVRGQYDGDYEDFRMAGSQTAALQALVQFTRAQGIPLVYVNLPLTDEYLDTYRREKETEYTQYLMQQSVGQSGFLFRDLGDLWPRQYDYFSDPSHLNRYGAYQLSRRLAQDPLIPWSEIRHQP